MQTTDGTWFQDPPSIIGMIMDRAVAAPYVMSFSGDAILLLRAGLPVGACSVSVDNDNLKTICRRDCREFYSLEFQQLVFMASLGRTQSALENSLLHGQVANTPSRYLVCDRCCFVVHSTSMKLDLPLRPLLLAKIVIVH